MPHPLVERRIASRHKVLKPGTLGWGQGAGISCMVRNLSHIGACVEVESPVGIPDDCTLVVGKDELRKTCHVVWRKAKRIGLRFELESL